MSRIEGRRPNASGQISTPGWEPVFGWMNAASQVPSGVLISTLVSTTSRPAAAADSAVAARPAVTERATKSRRARSSGCVSFFLWFFWSSIMATLSKSVSLFRLGIVSRRNSRDPLGIRGPRGNSPVARRSQVPRLFLKCHGPFGTATFAARFGLKGVAGPNRGC